MINRLFSRSSSSLLTGLAIAAAALCLAPSLHAQLTKDDLSGGKASPVQSPVDPLKIAIAGKVMLGGTDENSKKVLADMPGLLKVVNTKLSEYVKANDASMLLDPKKLTLANDSAVRIYFVGEGAALHNTLGFNTSGGKFTNADSKLIFPDASDRIAMYQTLTAKQDAAIVRLPSEPLKAGDFVNLGNFKAGTDLDFFLISNGGNGASGPVFSTEKAYNTDHINHVVSFLSKVGSATYLILGFEDISGGGDRDFNDLVFTLAISPIMAAPEPALWALMTALVGVAIGVKRRQSSLAAA